MPNEKEAIRFRIKQTRPVDPAEVEANHLARFNELVEDPAIFDGDRTGNGARRHFHVISGDGVLETAKIKTPHHFHISYVELPPGHEVRLHAHDVAEVFIPMTGTFEFCYGDNAEHSIVLNPFDTFSVPIDVMRSFKNIGLSTGLIIVIYDSPGDIHSKIFYAPDDMDSLREEYGATGHDVSFETVEAAE